MKTLLIIASLITLPIAARAQLIFQDDFNAGASPLWGNELGNWSATAGIYDAQAPGNIPPTYSSLPFLLDNFILDLDINNVADGGIWLRSTDNANGILLVTGAAANGLYWHIVNAGTFSPPTNVAPNLFASGISDPHLRITAEGNTYSVFVNGSNTPATTLIDNTHTTGKVALYDFSAQTFDNVVISAPEPTSLLLLALGAGLTIRRRRPGIPC